MSIEADVVSILERGGAPGWSVASGRGPETEIAAHGGFAELSPRRRPVTAATRFDVASLTKVVATLPIILRLVARDRLSLDTPAGDALDGLAWPQITVAQLLTHTAGLPPEPVRVADTPARLRERIIATPLAAAPGTTVAYSDVGFLLLGWIAEAVTGTGLDALFDDEVAGPLRMSRTGFGPLGPGCDVAATEPRPDGTAPRGTVHDETAAALGAPAGHAGVFSDAADLGTYLAAWSDPGEHWLPLALRVEATRDHTAATGGGHRGLGWAARHDRLDQLGDAWPQSAVFHSGFTGTSLALDPPSRRWVVLVTNDVHLGRGRGAINPVRRAVHTALAPTAATR